MAAAMRRLARVLALCLALGACAAGSTGAQSARPDGEGYAGVGALVTRIAVAGQPANWKETLMLRPVHERAAVELRYLGMDEYGRALFERRDVDGIAGAGQAPVAAPGTDAAVVAGGADARQIALDLRLVRQVHVQGKIVEVLEATPSGVVFRIY